MKQLKEIKLTEVSELIGVSEKQINKNFKRYIPKLEKYNISFEGKGKNRKFYTVDNISKSNEQIAYEMFEQIACNVWGFDIRTDIDKLLRYMSIILYIKDKKSTLSFFSNKKFAELVGVTETVIKKYKRKLVQNKVIMPLHLSKTITIVSNINSDNKIIVDNNLFDIYKESCKIVANTKNLTNKYEYEEVEKLMNSDKKEFSVSKIDKCIVFSYFKKELEIDKLYQIYKTEFTPSFLHDDILLDILVKAYRYKYPNDKLNMRLEKYNIVYLEDHSTTYTNVS